MNKQTVIALVVLALFGGVFAAKALTQGDTVDGATSGPGVVAEGVADGSITSVRNDAVADYDAALASGKPVYVLFHSLSCQPCVEISAVADQVIPEYEGEVVFVNAITDDPAGSQLAAKFSFQYIPTSFFLAPDGQVLAEYTGAMDGAMMRGYLDELVAGQ